MSDNILLLACLIIPLLVLVVLRVNAVMVFMSLCLGDVLVRYVAGNANSMLGMFVEDMSQSGASVLQIALLLAPTVLTAVFMVLSVHGKGRVFFNIFPAAGVALLGVLLTVPLLPDGARNAIEAGALWNQLTKLQTLIVGVSAIISLFFLWSQRRLLAHHEGKHRAHGHSK